MLKLTPFHDNDFERLLPYLKKFDPNLPDSSWKKLLLYSWDNPLTFKGMILEDNDNIVGFLSYIISKTEINGIIHTYCNISSWVVDVAYRKKSLQLLSPLFKIDNILILNLSPHENTLSIFDALRFNKISEYEYIANPFKAIIKGKSKTEEINYNIIEKIKKDVYSNYFSETELKYIEDLEPYSNVKTFCIEIVNNKNVNRLTLFFNKKALTSDNFKSKIKELPYSIIGRKYQYELLYTSSSTLLVEHLQNILHSFLQRSDVRSINLSEHFLRKKDPQISFLSKTSKHRPWYMYTGSEIDESQINILFTEKVLLDF